MEERRGHLRVLSMNLRRGCADREAVGRQIEALDIDVVAVQELSAAQAGVISELLPHGKLEPTPDCVGMGIALRHPGSVERLSLPDRDAQVVALGPGEWPNLPDRIELLNVHIQAPHCYPQWRSMLLRRDQVRALRAYLHEVSRPRRVLIGDFNSTPIWPAYRALGSHLDDAAKLHAKATRRRPLRTWGPWPGSPRLLRIDHAFTHGLAIERFEVVEIAGSDHSGILAELRIP